MLCVGISHKVATVNVRERYSYSAEEARRLGRKWIEYGWIQGILLVSTCNRTEFYLTGVSVDLSTILYGILRSKGYQRKEIDSLREWYVYCGQEAIGHFIAVAAGMDSMVLGEDDILHQIKIAYENTLLWNQSSQELNLIIQGSFRWVKRIKTETMLSKTPISVATLVSRLIQERYKKDRLISILLLGASGNMGCLVRKSLIKYDNYKVIMTKRMKNQLSTSLCRSSIIEDQGIHSCRNNNINMNHSIYRYSMEDGSVWVDFDHRYQCLPEIDVVISATKSSDYIFHKKELAHLCKSILWIDLGVPTDIDPKIGLIKGMERYDIDYFEQLAKNNNEKKSFALKDAQKLCHQGMEEISEYLCKRRYSIIS